jgi:hypothetical protein
VAKKNPGTGMFDALILKQTDRLARRLAGGAERLPRDDASTATAIEIYEVTADLHDTWTKKFEGRK